MLANTGVGGKSSATYIWIILFFSFFFFLFLLDIVEFYLFGTQAVIYLKPCEGKCLSGGHVNNL